MKIANINKYRILFDNGDSLSSTHVSDSCEYNYADFSLIEYLGDSCLRSIYDLDFDENNLNISVSNNTKKGFTLSDKENNTLFVYCKSIQYFSDYIENLYTCTELIYCSGMDIVYIIPIECEVVFCAAAASNSIIVT